jgi:hypothetical protein
MREKVSKSIKDTGNAVLTQLWKHYENNYQKNIRFIEINYPNTANKLKSLPRKPPFEKTKSGALTLKMREVYVESRYDPEKYEAGVARSLDAGVEHAVFLSSGLGYHINEFLRRSDANCTVVEKDAALFRAALHIIDPLLISRLTPFVGTEVGHVRAALATLLSRPLTVYRHPHGSSPYKDFYDKIEECIRGRLKERVASAVTERMLHRLWIKNILRNLRRLYLGYSGTEMCAGAFSGAALLVASGPFLEDIVGEIRRLEKEMPIFALLPSLPFLQKIGVIPDAVLVTDAGFGNIYRVVRGVKIPLLATYSALPAVLEQWKGPVYLFSHGLPLEENFAAIRARSVHIPMQGTSAAVLIAIARMMGFRPLLLGGFDYAYRGVKDHHEGAGFDSQFLSAQTRLANWQTRVVRRWRQDRPVKQISTQGACVVSTHKLMLYKEWIEKETASSDLFRLNHGLPIKNIAYLSAYRAHSGEVQKVSTGAATVDRVLGGPISPRLLEDDLRRIRLFIYQLRLGRKNAVNKLHDLFYGKSTTGHAERDVIEDVEFAVREFERCFPGR